MDYDHKRALIRKLARGEPALTCPRHECDTRDCPNGCPRYNMEPRFGDAIREHYRAKLLESL